MTAKGDIVVIIDVDEAERLYRDGATLAEIGRKFGVVGHTVKARLLARGVALRGREIVRREIDWDHVATQYRNGYSGRRLCKMYCVRENTVYDKLRERGVPIRRKWKRSSSDKAKCRKCGLVLKLMAAHENGVCCVCLAIKKGEPLGEWVWAAED